MNAANDNTTRKPKGGDFFLIDAEQFAKVAPDLNQALVYIVVNRGSGPDGTTSSWSAKAVSKVTGIHWRKADQALDALEAKGLLRTLRAGTKPQRAIVPSAIPRHVFLPNALVDGVGYGPSPLAQMARLGNADVVALLVAIYEHQNLEADGGLAWDGSCIRQNYTRTPLTATRAFASFDFANAGTAAYEMKHPLVRRFGLSLSGLDRFWTAWGVLRRLGLIEMVPHLVSPGTGIVHYPLPRGETSLPVEKETADIARRTTFAALPPAFRFRAENHCDCLVLVDAMMAGVEVVGIYRTTFRAKTALTAAWYAKQHAMCEEAKAWFARVAEQASYDSFAYDEVSLSA